MHLPQLKLALGQVFIKFNLQEGSRGEAPVNPTDGSVREAEPAGKRYAFAEIEAGIYRKYSAELRKEAVETGQSIDLLAGPLSNHQNLVEKELSVMLNLSESWEIADG